MHTKKHLVSRTRYAMGALALCVTLSASANAAMRSVGTPEVAFTAFGPAGLRIVGTGHALEAHEDSDGKLLVRVRLDDLDSGIELRDRHTRDLLETARFPNAELRVTKATLDLTHAHAEGDARGELTLHGQTRPIAFHYTAATQGNDVDIRANATIDIEEFGMTPPGYLGITVRPSVEIRVEFRLHDDTSGGAR